MELSAQTVESLFTLKHRLLHFISNTNETRDEIEHRDQQITHLSDTVNQLKQQLVELERNNTKLTLQLQQCQLEQTQQQQQQKQHASSLHNPSTNRIIDTEMNNNPLSTTTSSSLLPSLPPPQPQKDLQEDYLQLKSQFELMKTALAESKTLTNTLQIESDRRQRDLELLQVKHSYLSNKYKTLEGHTGENINDLTTNITTRSTNFDHTTTEFNRFLTLYQGNVIYTTKHMGYLHVNIDQLNLALETKLKNELRLERDLLQVKNELAQKEIILQDLSTQNTTLINRHEHFSKQYKHTLGLLQSNLLLGLQQQPMLPPPPPPQQQHQPSNNVAIDLIHDTITKPKVEIDLVNQPIDNRVNDSPSSSLPLSISSSLTHASPQELPQEKMTKATTAPTTPVTTTTTTTATTTAQLLQSHTPHSSTTSTTSTPQISFQPQQDVDQHNLLPPLLEDDNQKVSTTLRSPQCLTTSMMDSEIDTVEPQDIQNISPIIEPQMAQQEEEEEKEREHVQQSPSQSQPQSSQTATTNTTNPRLPDSPASIITNPMIIDSFYTSQNTSSQPEQSSSIVHEHETIDTSIRDTSMGDN